MGFEMMQQLMDGDWMETTMAMLPTVGLLVAMLAGLAVWLVGRSMARAACAVCGLVLGGLGGFLLGEMFAEQGAFGLPLVIGGAIAGTLLAGLLFRVWIALSGAVVLALVVPAAVLVWQGTPAEGEAGAAGAAEAQRGEADVEAGDGDAVGLGDLLRRSLANEGEGEGEGEGGESGESAEVEQVIEAAAAVARQWYDEQTQRVGAWWSELGPGTRWTIYVAAAAGAAVGLVLGLVLPYVAVSVETALVGAVLLMLAGRELAAMHAPGLAEYFPQSPRMTVIWLGLITVVGFAIQWTLFARRADK